MKSKKIDFKTVNRVALSQAETLVGDLLPDGKKIGCEWVASNPRRVDKNLGSFKVNLITGRWADFATESKGGDLISLFAFTQNISQLEACKQLARKLGVQ